METPQLIGGFKEKFEKFIYLYGELKKDNELLKVEVEKLKIKLSDNEVINRELNHKLETTSLAKTLMGSGSDSKEAKNKINKIVREIDNCIALLNR